MTSTLTIYNADNNLQGTAIYAPLAKRRVLDKLGYLLEDITKALARANNNSCIPDSCPIGIQDYLQVIDTNADYLKILSSVSINCVKFN